MLRRRKRGRRFLELHFCARNKPQLPVSYHPFTRGESFIDNSLPVGAAVQNHGTGVHCHIWLDYVNKLALLAVLQGLRGDNDRIRLLRQSECNVDELSRPETAVTIGEFGFSLIVPVA